MYVSKAHHAAFDSFDQVSAPNPSYTFVSKRFVFDSISIQVLTLIALETSLYTFANSVDPDQRAQRGVHIDLA